MSLAITTEDRFDRSIDRSMPEEQVDQPIRWAEYLDRYESMCPTFDSGQALPSCFAEACLAVCRAQSPINSRIYQSAFKAIEQWGKKR